MVWKKDGIKLSRSYAGNVILSINQDHQDIINQINQDKNTKNKAFRAIIYYRYKARTRTYHPVPSIQTRFRHFFAFRVYGMVWVCESNYYHNKERTKQTRRRKEVTTSSFRIHRIAINHAFGVLRGCGGRKYYTRENGMIVGGS
jgi:hypothetical protein